MNDSRRWLGPLLLFCLLAGPAFAQGVIVNGQGTATLTWTPPTQYADATDIQPGELQGYVIFWNDASRFESDGVTLRPGCAAGPVGSRNDMSCYPSVLDITSGSSTTEVLTFDLSTDVTLSFAIVAHTSNLLWSDYSNESQKTFTLVIDAAPGPPTLETVDITMTCTTNTPGVSCEFIVQ